MPFGLPAEVLNRPMKAYCCMPQVVYKTERGGSMSISIATFYLFRSVQGIVDQANAEAIVRKMFNPLNLDTIEVHPNCNLVEVIEDFERD